MAQFLIFIAFGFVFPFLPLFVQQLGVGNLQRVELWSGVINFGQSLVLAIFSPVWGVIADRHGRRPMALRVAFAGAVVIGLMGLSQNVWQLLILRLLQGALTGFVSASTALAASFVPRERLAFALGMMQMALFAGTAIGPLAGGFVSNAVGFRWSFLVTAVLMVLAGAIILFFVKEQFEPPDDVEDTARGLRGIIENIRGAGRDPQLMTIMLVMFSVQFGANTVVPILPLFVQTIDASASAAAMTGIIFTVTGVVSAITAVFVGRLTGRFGYRKLLIVMALGEGLFYIPQTFVRSVLQLAVLRGVLGFFDGGIIPTANALVGSSSSTSEQGTTYGLIYMATGLGYAFGPLAGGLVAASLNIRAVFLVTAITLIAIAIYIPFKLEDLPPRGRPGDGTPARAALS
ncbi:MAG: MFS transporter [Chloroflexota bacterium]